MPAIIVRFLSLVAYPHYKAPPTAVLKSFRYYVLRIRSRFGDIQVGVLVVRPLTCTTVLQTWIAVQKRTAVPLMEHTCQSPSGVTPNETPALGGLRTCCLSVFVALFAKCREAYILQLDIFCPLLVVELPRKYCDLPRENIVFFFWH